MNKSDKKLIIIICIIAVSLIIIKELTNKDSNYAYVYYQNEIIKKIDLRVDELYTVSGYNGDVVIEIKDKKIRVKEENSPLHICSLQGWVSNGTPIICLPNKIVIKIENKDDSLDTVIG